MNSPSREIVVRDLPSSGLPVAQSLCRGHVGRRQVEGQKDFGQGCWQGGLASQVVADRVAMDADRIGEILDRPIPVPGNLT
jgi:hypothetical protein